MEFETIQRSTTSLMIVDQILNHLETGKLKAGDKLPPERVLCKMFGVGRSSVREAIRALVVMGNLEVIQGKGTFIRQVSPSGDQSSFLENALDAMPLFDLMEAREILETRVVQLAADHVDKVDICLLHKIINRMADHEGDIKAFYEKDLYFHHALAESTGNLVISEMMKVITKMIHKHRYKFMVISAETREKNIATARSIVQLIGHGEGEKAAEVVREHFRLLDTKLISLISDAVKENSDSMKSPE